MKGKFIVFEGIDGTGKGTLLKLVTEELERLTNGHYHSTRLPGGSKVGEEVRKILFETVKTANISNDAIELLFMANATHDTEREIRPRLDKGITVVIDRYHASHLAYAEERRPTGESVRQLSKSFASVKPDLTVLLIGDPEVLLSRARGRGDGKQEAKAWNDVEIQRRVQDHYLRSCGGDPTTLVVDTTWADPAWTFEMLIRPRLRSLFIGAPEPQIRSVARPVPIRQPQTDGRLCGVVEILGGGVGKATCGNHRPCPKHLPPCEHVFGVLCCVTCGLPTPPDQMEEARRRTRTAESNLEKDKEAA